MPSASLVTNGQEPGPTGLDIPCMFTPDCNTGAVRRKVISHMFGRNKLCTRMIPTHVWVHYCRKHYQRVRYRNGVEYSKLQVGLVLDQVKRVQAWSDENKANSRPGVVRDWSLSIRKREQKRLEDKSVKRDGEDDSDHEGGATIDGAVLNGTAVPSWLLAKCGSGYRTPQIEAIITQLKTEIWDGRLQQIPDIELLPNITDDDPVTTPQRKVTQKRKSAAGSTHRRTQSMGVGLQPEALPPVRRVSQANDYLRHNVEHESHLGKRQRIADTRIERAAMPGMRRIHGLPHRPAFSNIRENQSEDTYYEQESPVPVQTNGDVDAVYTSMQRPLHCRSYSDDSFAENTSYARLSTLSRSAISCDNHGLSPAHTISDNVDYNATTDSHTVFQQPSNQPAVDNHSRPFEEEPHPLRVDTPSCSPQLRPLSHHARHQSSPNNIGMIAHGFRNGSKIPQPTGDPRSGSLSRHYFSSVVPSRVMKEDTSPF
jgi:hypothetical protein